MGRREYGEQGRRRQEEAVALGRDARRADEQHGAGRDAEALSVGPDARRRTGRDAHGDAAVRDDARRRDGDDPNGRTRYRRAKPLPLGRGAQYSPPDRGLRGHRASGGLRTDSDAGEEVDGDADGGGRGRVYDAGGWVEWSDGADERGAADRYRGRWRFGLLQEGGCSVLCQGASSFVLPPP